ncbi:coumaroyl-CoA:anthocyanidin 3-O-glucoside-6''-O-coumaroyltransferase 1 [Lathyrus oleraceus]|nr:coumaroyl-CoA:anthocyanidin 3-O-glucoside-6''-O-coumaroyltransferase 1-like [Pisum sativum]
MVTVFGVMFRGTRGGSATRKDLTYTQNISIERKESSLRECGNQSPPPHKPFILCTQNDSVNFTIIESSADFKHLSTFNHPKNIKDFDHLFPKLTHKTIPDDIDIESNKTFIFPLLALQVSVFPGHGVCIGITFCHLMDGISCTHFMNFWSLIHRRGDGVELKPPPCFDRDILKDPKRLEEVFSSYYFSNRKTWKDKSIVGSKTSEEYVKAITVFEKEEIEKMKRWVLSKWIKDDEEITAAPQFLSKFVVTCGFVWAIMIKTMYRNDDNDDERIENFFFAGNCRENLGYPIPEGYFGNCLALHHASLKRKDMKGENGFLNAVKVIEKAVTEMKNEPFKDADEWMVKYIKMFEIGNIFSVRGSPKFNVYEIDFGFGKPVKVETMHSSRVMSLAESRDEEDGLEVGLVFKIEEYEYFCSLREQGLATFTF